MQNKARLDDYVILKTLGTGYTGKVKLGRDIETGMLYALKILDPTKMDHEKFEKVILTLENELNMMRKLDHKNIVRFLDLHTSGTYTTKRGLVKTVSYAVIELADKGEIFEVLFKVGPFNENMARFYMKQLVDALSYLHTHKVAHRDLKPENLLMDDTYNLKLADFGFATIYKDEQKNKTKLGTERYMSPELLLKQPYDAHKVDIFASGVILFIFYSGHPPFYQAIMEDPYYKLFVDNNSKFWEFHTTQNKKKEYSEDFIALANGMMAHEPHNRLSIEEIMGSKWLTDHLDEEKALKDMETYVAAMNRVVQQSSAMQEEQVKQSNKACTNETNDDNTNPKDNYANVETEAIKMAQKNSPNVISLRCKNKTTLIENVVYTVRNLPNTKVVWNDAKDRMKIKFTTEHDESVLVKVRIYEGKGGLFKIEFAKQYGPCFDYYKFKARFREYMEENA